MHNESLQDSAKIASSIFNLSKLPAREWRSLQIPDCNEALGNSNIVAFHYWKFGIGGAERITSLLIQLFIDLGKKVILYTDVPEERGDHPLPSSVLRKTVPTGSSEERALYWLQEIKNEKIAVVVYSGWLLETAPIDCLSIVTAGARLIYHTHGSSSYFIDSSRSALHISVMQKAASVADTVIALSEADAVFWRTFSDQVFVVPNPVSMYLGKESPFKSPSNSKTVVYCGRLDPAEKRIDLILDSFAIVLKTIPTARLSLIGGDNAFVLNDLKQQAKRIGIIDSIDFHGNVANPLPLLRSSNVMVISSPTEGFCLSLAEACAIGLPCVAFEMPNLSLLECNEGVIVVPQGDVSSMATQIIRILEDDGLHSRMSKATRKAYEDVCQIDLAGLWGTILTATENKQRNKTNPDENSPQARLVKSFVLGCEREFIKRDSKEADLQRQIDGLNQQIRRIESSKSYKVGLGLLAPARAARKAVSKIRMRS